MNIFQQTFVFVYFILILFNVNTVLGILLGRVGIMSDALMLIGIVSLTITMPRAANVCRTGLMRSLFVFIGVFLFFGTLAYILSPSRAAGGFEHGLYILSRSIIIIIPFSVLFVDKARKNGLFALLRELFILFFIACLTVPIFKEIGVSFEEKMSGYSYVYTRYSGIWANSDVAACFINSSAILGLYLKIKKEISPFIFYFCYLILGYCVLLTFSTTGALVFISSLIVYFYYSFISGKLISIKPAFLILIIPITYFGVLWLANYLVLTGVGYAVIKSENLINILTLSFDEIDYSSRDIMLYEGLALIKQHWITGYGIGYFGRPIFDKIGVMHNYFLVMWGEAGVIGLLNVIGFLGYLIYKMIRTNVKTMKFVFAITFTFYALYFFNGTGLIGNFNMLIYYSIIVTISHFVGRSGYLRSDDEKREFVEDQRA